MCHVLNMFNIFYLKLYIFKQFNSTEKQDTESTFSVETQLKSATRAVTIPVIVAAILKVNEHQLLFV